nr:hypothetical protein [Actinomycetota bacterium]
MTNTARQPKGIPVGGQFAVTTHADPEVRLVLAHLREYARPLPYPPGSRVMVDGEFGTISGNPDPYTGALYINMDAGGCIVTKPANVVPWDAYLDTVMPAVDHNPDPDSDNVPQPTLT